MKVVLVLLVALLAGASGLSAQEATDDSAIRFARTIDSVTSEAVLDALADSLSESTPGGALALAMVRYRQGELGDLDRFLESVSLLEHVLKHDPSLVNGWLLLGLSRVELDKAGYTGKLGLLQGYGEGYPGGAVNALLRTLNLDPGNMQAVQALIGMVLAGSFPRDPEVLLPYLDSAVARQSGEPAAYLALVRLNVELKRYEEAEQSYENYLAAGGDTLQIYVPDDRTPEQLLAEAESQLSDLAHLYLFQARLRFTEGDYDSALAAIDRYGAVGGLGSTRLFERSRILFALGETVLADSIYFAGATLPPSAGEDAYEQDIAWLADSAELAEFRELAGKERADWLLEFWHTRDVSDAQPLGARLAEHRRRLVYAVQHFAVRKYRRLGVKSVVALAEIPQQSYGPMETVAVRDMPETDLSELPQTTMRRLTDSPQLVFDDRGPVYIRHGTPDEVANYPGLSYLAWESWLYQTPEGSFVAHFNNPPGLGPEFFLVDQTGSDWMATCQLDSTYCVLAGKRAAGSLQDFDLRQARERRWDDARHLLATDENSSHKISSFEPIIQFYGMPGRIVAVYSIPASGLRRIDATVVGPVSYPVRLRLSAAEKEKGAIFQTDTTGAITVQSPPGNGQYLSSIMEQAVSPGTYLVSLAISDTADRLRGAMRLPELEVPRFGTGRLAMSDLILGKAGGLVWKSGGMEIALNPLGAFQVGSSAELYYQVDGQTAGKNYRTGIAVIEGEDDEVISLEFREMAASPRQWYHRSLGLARVSPGTYRVRVTIKDTESGITISREQRLNVVR